MRRLLIVGVLALAACGPSVTDGSVIKTWMVPAHDEDRQGVCLYSDSKTHICYIYQHYTVHVSDVCWVRLRADDKNATEADVIVACDAVPQVGAWVHVS